MKLPYDKTRRLSPPMTNETVKETETALLKLRPRLSLYDSEKETERAITADVETEKAIIALMS